MAIPHTSIAQTLDETKEVKAQLLDGKGVAVERIHYANQLAFVVLKAIAFDERGANKDVGDLSTFCSTAATWRRALARSRRISNRVPTVLRWRARWTAFDAASAPAATRRAIS